MSPRPLLVIGDKTYSSWSLRPWLMLRHAGIDFEEKLLWLHRPEFRGEVARYSPSGRVPALHHGDIVVWESLAILEYINDTWLAGRGWPQAPAARAHARAIASEMHAGFAALRRELSLNLRRKAAPLTPGHDAAQDIRRVLAIWQDTRTRFGAGGPFLLGAFSCADAMYAPVALRFEVYGIELPAPARAYVDAILALPAITEWRVAAEQERD